MASKNNNNINLHEGSFVGDFKPPMKERFVICSFHYSLHQFSQHSTTPSSIEDTFELIKIPNFNI